MHGEPHVSVCIRAYSRSVELRASIASALRQTYTDLEVVVSDDSGRLRGVVESFDDPRVRYHRNPEPAGPTGNLSRVVSLARSPLVAILNDDDEWLPGFLATTVELLDRHPDVGIAFTDDFLEAGRRRVRRRLPYRAGRHDRILRDLLEHSMPASATVARRAVWDGRDGRAPIPPGGVGMELVWLRAASNGWPFYYVDEPLAISRFSRDQVSVSDAELPTRQIATYGAFRFEDPASERLRRARVAEFLLARAHVRLRRRRFRDARADIARANATSPRALGLRAVLALSGLRGLVIRWGCSHPRALVALLALWRRIRPPVLPRRRLARRGSATGARSPAAAGRGPPR
jgi:glycosyltransferase involved in cell wall biosynthesis